MADNIIEGTGTEQDPYIITTMAELYAKASESGAYLRIHNNINITDEYPDGSLPEIQVNSIIDGNNKMISNWYNVNSYHRCLSMGANSVIHDLIFSNIYTSEEFVFFRGDGDYHFVNCKFRGIAQTFAYAVDNYGSTKNFSSCSFNVKCSIGLFNSTWSYVGMRNCRIKFTNDSTATAIIPSCKYINNEVDSCYIVAPCKLKDDNATFINCVCDLTTSQTFTMGGNSDKAKCIINSTHAPNASVESNSNFALVSDSDWLDVSYLRSIGFNAG